MFFLTMFFCYYWTLHLKELNAAIFHIMDHFCFSFFNFMESKYKEKFFIIEFKFYFIFL